MKRVTANSILCWLLLPEIVAFGPSLPASLSSYSSLRFSSFLSEPCHRVQPQRRSGVGLKMMFDQLSTAITKVASQLGPKQRMTEKSIKPALRDVRRALLDADVNVEVADTLINGVKKRTLGTQVLEGVTSEQQFIKAMYDELLDMMGGDSTSEAQQSRQSQQEFLAAGNTPVATLSRGTVGDPAVILLAGLQGAGKTTAAGKLALFLQEREVDYQQAQQLAQDAQEKEDKDEKDQVVDFIPSRLPKTNRKVLLVAADVYRPAAIKQLQILGEQVGVTVYAQGTEDDPVDIVKNGIQKAKDEEYDTVIVDTAGRQVIDDNLMQELQRMKQVSQAVETLLIVDAMTGQEAASLTAAFDNAVGLTGAILTKLDGDSRGGAAVSVRGVSGKPIKFVGVGEKTNDLEPFYPDRMASRILGMGDVVSLVEKAAEKVSDKEALELQQKMADATFDFEDFMKQSEMINSMGSVANFAKMIPGLGGQLDRNQIRSVEERLKKNKAMINSMTKQERKDPDLLIRDSTSQSRLTRITKGCGLTYEDGQQFVSEFQKMRTMMARMQKQMGAGGGDNMEEAASAVGNRAMRRSAKKQKKGRSGGGGGFGK